MRLKVLKIIYLAALFAIVVRLYYWQVIKFDQLTALAEQQHLINLSLQAPRGLIFASDGSVLASNQPDFLLFGRPKYIEDKNQVAKKLADILNQGAPDLSKRLSQDIGWVNLAKNVDYQTKIKIEQLGISGIGFDNTVSRLYPEASMAAHVLGFAGLDSIGHQVGYFGIEGYYNRELEGVEGSMIEEKDAQGLPILVGKFSRQDPLKGDDLVLNIDRTVQYLVEKEIQAGVEKYGAKSGSAIVMDPKTGAVLSMVSYPSYDPNHYTDFSKEYFKNPNVADSYEPGSTFKVLIMAAALNEGLVKPDSRCDSCSGPVRIADFDIRTWDNKYYPDTTIADVIIHSDNTGMVYVGKKLGIDRTVRYIQNFGFGNLTQIDLQDESSPQLRNLSDWREIDLATATFGQGVAVTPIQMVRAVSAIANGGYLMEPHIVSVIKTNTKTIQIKPKIVGRPISQETAKVVTQMMVDAVDKGEAKFFKPEGYKIAGKTGTAQIAVTGHYDPTKTIASFVGFAPADNPKFIMLVRFDEPSASIFGAETAAPTFFSIAKQLFNYYNIPPS